MVIVIVFFFSSRRRHTRCALVTGVQTCALPILSAECQEIEILWTEHDGPQVTEPKRRGFGLNLVDRETSFNLRGTATAEFLPTGVCVKMRFPMSDGGQG